MKKGSPKLWLNFCGGCAVVSSMKKRKENQIDVVADPFDEVPEDQPMSQLDQDIEDLAVELGLSEMPEDVIRLL